MYETDECDWLWMGPPRASTTMRLLNALIFTLYFFHVEYFSKHLLFHNFSESGILSVLTGWFWFRMPHVAVRMSARVKSSEELTEIGGSTS